MRRLYLVLAILGALVPYAYFFQFIGNEGLDLGAFVSALFVNGAAGGFTADLLISSFTFWLFMAERRRHGGPAPWPFVLVNLLIGLSCALPAYLYMRERES